MRIRKGREPGKGEHTLVLQINIGLKNEREARSREHKDTTATVTADRSHSSTLPPRLARLCHQQRNQAQTTAQVENQNSGSFTQKSLRFSHSTGGPDGASQAHAAAELGAVSERLPEGRQDAPPRAPQPHRVPSRAVLSKAARGEGGSPGFLAPRSPGKAERPSPWPSALSHRRNSGFSFRAWSVPGQPSTAPPPAARAPLPGGQCAACRPGGRSPRGGLQASPEPPPHQRSATFGPAPNCRIGFLTPGRSPFRGQSSPHPPRSPLPAPPPHLTPDPEPGAAPRIARSRAWFPEPTGKRRSPRPTPLHGPL